MAQHQARLIIHEDGVCRWDLRTDEVYSLAHARAALIFPGHIRLMMKSEGITYGYDDGSSCDRDRSALPSGRGEEIYDACQGKHRKKDRVACPAVWVTAGHRESAVYCERRH